MTPSTLNRGSFIDGSRPQRANSKDSPSRTSLDKYFFETDVTGLSCLLKTQLDFVSLGRASSLMGSSRVEHRVVGGKQKRTDGEKPSRSSVDHVIRIRPKSIKSRPRLTKRKRRRRLAWHTRRPAQRHVNRRRLHQ